MLRTSSGKHARLVWFAPAVGDSVSADVADELNATDLSPNRLFVDGSVVSNIPQNGPQSERIVVLHITFWKASDSSFNFALMCFRQKDSTSPKKADISALA